MKAIMQKFILMNIMNGKKISPFRRVSQRTLFSFIRLAASFIASHSFGDG